MWTVLAIFFLQFADKVGAERVCLSETAIEKREARGIAIDSLDFEVSPVYLDSVRAMGAKVLHTSRWINGATVEANNEAIRAIEKCSFVDTIYLTRMEPTEQAFDIPSISLRKRRIAEDTLPDAPPPVASIEQLDQLNLLPLHQAGYRGKGIRIGVADGGFYNANIMTALPKEQWLGYADFTDDEDDFFGSTGNHGTLCLTAIIAEAPDYQGTATEAEYFLFRTEEHYSESPKEIDNWVAAIEMADSLGLDIVSTSLGYTTFDNEHFDFTYADMDGRCSRGAQVATIAARKGMLLIMAAGNEGNNEWHYLSTPADADSILTVGAVDIDGEIAAFSSYGPSADGRVKPEVCAVGKQTVLLNPSDGFVITGNGTSFACPLIAGMAACLWSALPGASNMEIRERIIRSADRYNAPHEQYGYGIPDAWKAYGNGMGNNLSKTNGQVTFKPQKIWMNGHLWIKKDNTLYNMLGTLITTH